MSQDVVSDGLNQIMNAKRIEKRGLVIKRYSKVLVNLLEMMKVAGHVDYEVTPLDSLGHQTGRGGGVVKVKILKLNECRAVKPRYYVGVADIDKYLRRFLPSRNFGTLVISTNKGLMSHKDAVKENLGGSVVAYYY